MGETAQSVYFVNAEGDPLRLAVKGRASYTNCAPAQIFLETATGEGSCSLVIDFALCTGMDSTFLGLLAGAALRIKGRRPSPGEVTLTGLNTRNLELVRNLGLHRLMRVENTPCCEGSAQRLTTQAPLAVSKETILDAHECLMKIDPANDAKFRDVVSYLRRTSPPKP